MKEPRIFNVPMVPQVLPGEQWRLAVGVWRLTIISRASQEFWAVEIAGLSTTIASGYAGTPELAARAIESWLDDVVGAVRGLKSQGEKLERFPGMIRIVEDKSLPPGTVQVVGDGIKFGPFPVSAIPKALGEGGAITQLILHDVLDVVKFQDEQ